jgi:hypothetical protein
MRALLAALLVASSGAHAARPMVTDDARLVDEGGCQLETFLKRQRKYHEHEFALLPACNPWGKAELALGAIRVDSSLPGDSRVVTVQAKTILRPLQANGAGFALALGVGRLYPFRAPRVSSPYVNGIGSYSLLDDRVVVHANLGAVRDRQIGLTRGTWGVGAEVRLAAPRLYGVVEQYGQRLDKPAFHAGPRFWLVPDRLQVNATVGRQHATPVDRRFGTVGLGLYW